MLRPAAIFSLKYSTPPPRQHGGWARVFGLRMRINEGPATYGNQIIEYKEDASMSTTSTQSTPGAYDVRELIGRIARRLNLSDRQVRGTVDLLDEGNTVPFIARYRKEGTGNLDEVQIRDVAAVAEEIRQLEDRRAMIIKTIEEQGKPTKALRAELARAETMSRLDDLYAHYKQKRRTRGQKAREAGLEPVVEAILQGGDFLGIAQRHLGEDFATVDEVIGGAKDIIA